MVWLPKKANVGIYFPEERFRVNPDPNRRVSQLVMTIINAQWWLIHEDAADALENVIDLLWDGDLCEAQLSDGTVFFLPVVCPRECAGGDELHDFLLHTAQLAKTEWMTIEADAQCSGYKVVPQSQPWPDPVRWPEHDLVDAVENAFASRYITADYIERQRSFHSFLTDACDHGYGGELRNPLSSIEMGGDNVLVT